MRKAVEQKTKTMIVIAYENILKGREALLKKNIALLGYKLDEIEEEETLVSWSGMELNIKTRAKPAAAPRRETAKPAAPPRRETAKPAAPPRRETAKPAAQPPNIYPAPQEIPHDSTAKFQHEELQYRALQAKYLETRDNMFLDKMYLMCLEIAARYIKKVASGRKICLEVNDLAHDAASYVICRYINDLNFRLNPMAPYIFLACKSAMSRDKTWNMRKVSFEDWMQEAI